ncbi:hypothetical protein AQUCO_00100730v1 [Aquilegia coerulea]|uniref:Uncharacterized protein n=1 Tax=Aquilegia coerulea TaxID=218851 RepID=A0A2G5FBP4_AQUCA|nr:hypothetical protein AQUCO_00100730v1 [Aquilegia coerulea]
MEVDFATLPIGSWAVQTDIVRHTFEEECTAIMRPRGAFSSLDNGQAYLIFHTKAIAERVVDELQRRHIMMEDERPLIASKGNLEAAVEHSKFIGHQSIVKVDRRQKQRSTDWKEAVGTSHYPQPNTIEYDMAVEWCRLHHESDLWWKALHEVNIQKCCFPVFTLLILESSHICCFRAWGNIYPFHRNKRKN